MSRFFKRKGKGKERKNEEENALKPKVILPLVERVKNLNKRAKKTLERIFEKIKEKLKWKEFVKVSVWLRLLLIDVDLGSNLHGHR